MRTRFGIWSGEGPTCLRATKEVRHNYQAPAARACGPQQEKPPREAKAPQLAYPPHSVTREIPAHSNEDLAQPKKKTTRMYDANFINSYKHRKGSEKNASVNSCLEVNYNFRCFSLSVSCGFPQWAWIALVLKLDTHTYIFLLPAPAKSPVPNLTDFCTCFSRPYNSFLGPLWLSCISASRTRLCALNPLTGLIWRSTPTSDKPKYRALADFPS